MIVLSFNLQSASSPVKQCSVIINEFQMENHLKDTQPEDLIRRNCFEDKSDLSLQSTEHTYTCSVCDQTFESYADLSVHTSEFHYECSFCDQSFSDSFSLYTHMKYTHYECSMCDQLFSDSGSLSAHMESKHTCLTRGKYFKYKHDLTTHLKTCTDDTLHVCNHMKTHSEERPHTCGTCGKSYKRKADLTFHLRIHRGERNSLIKSIRLSLDTQTHNVQNLSSSHVSEAFCPQEVPLTWGGNLFSTEHSRALDPYLIKSRSERLPGLHSWDAPYVINVKTEDDI